MPVAGAGRIERRVDSRRRESRARRALGQRRSADIAETEEEDRGGICSIFTHIAHVLHEVEPTFNLRVRRALLAMAGEAIIVEGEGCQWQERRAEEHTSELQSLMRI